MYPQIWAKKIKYLNYRNLDVPLIIVLVHIKNK
jgi:hypothetical protein